MATAGNTNHDPPTQTEGPSSLPRAKDRVAPGPKARVTCTGMGAHTGAGRARAHTHTHTLPSSPVRDAREQTHKRAGCSRPRAQQPAPPAVTPPPMLPRTQHHARGAHGERGMGSREVGAQGAGSPTRPCTTSTRVRVSGSPWHGEGEGASLTHTHTCEHTLRRPAHAAPSHATHLAAHPPGLAGRCTSRSPAATCAP
jgi:hypothetical protein